MAAVEDCCEGGALLLLLGEDTVGDGAIVSDALCERVSGEVGCHRMTIP